MNFYKLYGLKIKSFVSSHRISQTYAPYSQSDFDVEIVSGSVNYDDVDHIHGNWFKSSDGVLIYKSDALKASVDEKSRIIIEGSGEDGRLLEQLAFQTLMLPVLLLWGYFPFKGSAIDFKGDAVAFLGDSNTGKSDISKRFVNEKTALFLSSGLLVLKLVNDNVFACPGLDFSSSDPTKIQHRFIPIKFMFITPSLADADPIEFFGEGIHGDYLRRFLIYNWPDKLLEECIDSKKFNTFVELMLSKDEQGSLLVSFLLEHLRSYSSNVAWEFVNKTISSLEC